MHKHSPFSFRIEPLESRIAPASLFHYTDVDGDKVTIVSSAGDLNAGGVVNVVGGQLQELNLSGGGFDGAHITFSIVKGPHGDGLANVGYINSTGHDLGSVTVKGDLGRIDAGDATTATTGLKSLNVRSIGRLGIDTQAPGGSVSSTILGPLGALFVKSDVDASSLSVTGGVDGRIGSIFIGGSLIGGSTGNTGEIVSDGAIGPVRIGHDIVGGSSLITGILDSNSGGIASVFIGGSLIGGSATDSGEIFSKDDIGPVKILHDMRGGSGTNSGLIKTTVGSLASLTIGGSLFGGTGTESGTVLIQNNIGPVKITHDLSGNGGIESGEIFAFGNLASVNIGGSIIGGSGVESGFIIADQNLGAIKVNHDIVGGSGIDTGEIVSIGNLAGLNLGGSLIGGTGTADARIVSDGDMGQVNIGHDIRGGNGTASALVQSGGKLAGVSIGGSLVGGTFLSGSGGDLDSGFISASGDIGAISIGHDLIGGSITGSATLNGSGYIHSTHNINSITIGGSIISGIDTSSGSLSNNASIRAGDSIGSLVVKGSLVGNTNTSGNSPVIITARGQAAQGATTDVAMGKISIGSRVEHAFILAGYNTNLSAKNADAQIGPVSVGGDWIASDLVAGAQNSGFPNFGDTNDAKITGGTDTAGILSKIARIVIGGQVFGTPTLVSTTDHFGFVAQQIGLVKIGGNMIALAATTTPQPVGETSDVDIHLLPTP